MSLGFNLSGLRPRSISEGTCISEAWGQGAERLSLDLEYTEGHWGPDRSGARRESKTESDRTRMKSRREGLFDIRTWLPTVHVVNYLYGSVASPNTETKVRERVSTSEHR